MRKILAIICFYIIGLTTSYALQTHPHSALQPSEEILQLRQQIDALNQKEEPLKQQIREIEAKILPLRLELIKMGGGHGSPAALPSKSVGQK